jgi:predicted TIM-barrel fold metal-dependent hydrolase
VEAGYKVYTDTTWSIGFGARWLLTDIERRGVGAVRVIFASDEPWSDFWSEYWKIEGVPVSSELKDRIFHRNFEELYGHKCELTDGSADVGPSSTCLADQAWS